ncbi:MAG: HlyD family secretion protein [Treponema sp.]|jgi:multidrug resistance efflux pump|nr:HlyD family secretion protein [Treponema sp.]
MRFTDMETFREGQEFFMLKPSPAAGAFILLALGMVCGAVVWALVCPMDDIIKVTAFLRPAANISTVRPFAGGEMLEKRYTQDSYIHEGDILLQIDVSSDAIELENTKKLMERVARDMRVSRSVLAVITNNNERGAIEDEEAAVRAAAYMAEYRRQAGLIATARVKLEREQMLPSEMQVPQKTDDLERELRQNELGLASWRNSRMAETMDAIKSLLQNQESLERRMADLERNIKNATLRAPVSGRISETRKLNTGDYIMAGEEIVRIIPGDGEELKAELMVDAAYVARVKEGQRVTLRFPGLPPSKFGQLEAVVRLIPADYSVETGLTAYFIVEAAIAEPWLVSPNGEKLRLKPGVGAQARIITEQDTVMRMLLKKLDFIN